MSKKCLVVDDVEVSRYVAREILEELEFSVEEAVSVQAALESLKVKKFDLIVLDWHLKKSQSLEFIPDIRAITGYEHVPIILSTGVEMEKDLNDIKGLSVQALIKKPLTFDLVKSELERLVIR